jgi:hypothetical protein
VSVQRRLSKLKSAVICLSRRFSSSSWCNLRSIGWHDAADRKEPNDVEGVVT